MSKLTSGWKRPIECSDFSSFTAKPVATEPGKRLFSETKDSSSETGHRLMAKVKMTFSGLKTKNQAVYLPDEHFKSAKTFISPYAKPILPHHDDEKDPIGRVVDIRYVDTSNAAINFDPRFSKIADVFTDKKSSQLQKLKTVGVMLENSDMDGYSGMGHLMGLWDVTDPDGIKKVMDGRYLTVSTTMIPKGAYCSTCALEGELTNWAVDDCDHVRGDVYKGKRCCAIPFDYEWDHVGPVNTPAATQARILEFGEDLSFSDAMSKVAKIVPYEIFSDIRLGTSGSKLRFDDQVSSTTEETSEVSTANTSNQNGTSVIGNIIDANSANSEGLDMKKLADLTKDSDKSYQLIAKLLEDGAPRLTSELLKSLDETVFAGPNRTFPLKDKAHALAGLSALEDIEDSEGKAVIVSLINSYLASLETEVVSTEAKVEDAAPTVAPAAPEAEPQIETVTISKAEFEVLAKAAADLEEAVTLKEILQQQIKLAKAEAVALNDYSKQLVAEYKDSLVTRLVDAQASKGFKIVDRAEAVKKLSSRSIESLKDSLSDIGLVENTGLAKAASGEVVADPRVSDEVKPSEDKCEDSQNYSGSISKYWDLYYGPNGEARAKAFWSDAKQRGIVPLNLNPEKIAGE